MLKNGVAMAHVTGILVLVPDGHACTRSKWTIPILASNPVACCVFCRMVGAGAGTGSGRPRRSDAVLQTPCWRYGASLRKGLAGKPCALKRFGSQALHQAYRTATGRGTSG